MRRRIPGLPLHRYILWWVVVRNIVRFWLWVQYRHRGLGRKHVPPDGPAIYAINHQSHLDAMMVGSNIGPYASMARTGLYEAKLLGWIIEGLGAIKLDQSKGDTAAFKAALGVLKEGGRVLIFPEGTRCTDGALAPFQPGTMLLVRRSKAPVVPVAVEGAWDVWPMGQGRPTMYGRLASRAGPPIPAEELLAVSTEEALDRLRREIEEMRMQLRADLRKRTKGRFPRPGAGDTPYWERETPDSLKQSAPGAV